MNDVGSCLAQRADVSAETAPVMSAARPTDNAYCGARAARSYPFDDVARDTDDRDIDAALKGRQQVGHTYVRTAALDVVCVCDEPHSRGGDRS